MFLTKISLAKGIRSKIGAAQPRQKFFGVPPWDRYLWKQSKWLASACQFLSSHLSGLGQEENSCVTPSARALLHRALFLCSVALRGSTKWRRCHLTFYTGLYVSSSSTVANGLKGTFTQGTVSPAGGLVPKRVQRRQRRRKLSQGPKLLRAAKLPAASAYLLKSTGSNLNGAMRQHSAAPKQRPV